MREYYAAEHLDSWDSKGEIRTLTVDGNQKSGINSQVEVKVVYLPLFTTGF